MRLVMQPLSCVLFVLIGLAGALAQGQGGVLDAIPSDALGFAVVHHLTDASRSIDDVAKLVQAPAPDLLSLAKRMTGLQQGLDEQGDLAIVLTNIEPAPKGVVLVPVANFADFVAALNVKDPTTGIVEVQLAGVPRIVGRKGRYAAIARATDRDALEQYLAGTTNFAGDAPLAAWLDANKASVVVTARGVKQLLPKLTNGIRAAQAQLRQVGGEKAQPAADALNLYVDLITAAEPEVEQFRVGLRIDSAQTVDLIKQLQFTPGGVWAQWAAHVKPAAEDLLAGFPSEPFVAALGVVVPPGATDHLMQFSLQMMQNQPQFELTPEQAQKYVELSARAMSGVQSMGMVLGVAEPGAGLYGNTSAVLTVEDSKRFLEDYEKTLVKMREFAQEVKSPAIPVTTSRHIMLGEMKALEVSMDLADMEQFAPPGGPDMQQMMQLMFGANGKLKVYVAPADDHAVVMTYTSPELLKSAVEFYRSKQPGLSGEAGLAEAAAALPPGAQGVAYVNLSGVVKVARQFAAVLPGGRAAAIPDFAHSPPLGIAVKVTPTGAEGHLIVTGETLRAIGDTVTKARSAAPGFSPPQK